MGAKAFIQKIPDNTKDSEFSLKCRLGLLTWGLSLKQKEGQYTI